MEAPAIAFGIMLLVLAANRAHWNWTGRISRFWQYHSRWLDRLAIGFGIGFLLLFAAVYFTYRTETWFTVAEVLVWYLSIGGFLLQSAAIWDRRRELRRRDARFEASAASVRRKARGPWWRRARNLAPPGADG